MEKLCWANWASTKRFNAKKCKGYVYFGFTLSVHVGEVKRTGVNKIKILICFLRMSVVYQVQLDIFKNIILVMYLMLTISVVSHSQHWYISYIMIKYFIILQQICFGNILGHLQLESLSNMLAKVVHAWDCTPHGHDYLE